MKVTVCELSNDPLLFEKEWDSLVEHCHIKKSDLVLLPEMPFYPWIAHQKTVSKSLQLEAVKAHEKWLQRLDEFGDAIVAYEPPTHSRARARISIAQ